MPGTSHPPRCPHTQEKRHDVFARIRHTSRTSNNPTQLLLLLRQYPPFPEISGPGPGPEIVHPTTIRMAKRLLSRTRQGTYTMQQPNHPWLTPRIPNTHASLYHAFLSSPFSITNPCKSTGSPRISSLVRVRKHKRTQAESSLGQAAANLPSRPRPSPPQSLSHTPARDPPLPPSLPKNPCLPSPKHSTSADVTLKPPPP